MWIDIQVGPWVMALRSAVFVAALAAAFWGMGRLLEWVFTNDNQEAPNKALSIPVTLAWLVLLLWLLLGAGQYLASWVDKALSG
jgi:hypothetical protein